MMAAHNREDNAKNRATEASKAKMQSKSMSLPLVAQHRRKMKQGNTPRPQQVVSVVQ